jgi:hypothetical protein
LHHQKLHIFIDLIAIIVFTSPLSAQSAAPDDGSFSSTSNIESAKPEKRLFGVVPNYRTVEASTPFVRLTPRQKLGVANRDSFDWPTYPLAAVMTLAMPGKVESKAYGSGWSGFANRYLRN